MGFSEILSHEMMGPHAVTAYKHYSADIHSSGHYLLSLIDDILDLSRIEAGRQELAEEPVDLGAVASACAKLLRTKADERSQALSFEIPRDCPRLIGDRRALGQILFNLVSNAIKFTPPHGKIAVSAALDDGERLVLSVRDSGPGIPSTSSMPLSPPLRAARWRRAGRSTAPALACRSSRDSSSFMKGSWRSARSPARERSPRRSSRDGASLPGQRSAGPIRWRSPAKASAG